MTAVKIRHEDDAEANFLADVPFSDLDTVIPTLRSWGFEGEALEMSGQFVNTEFGAYFEVILSDPFEAS